MKGLTRRKCLAAAAGVAGLACIMGLWRLRPVEKRPAGRIGGPFSLVDADGAPFGFKDMLGTPSLVYFGFTHCPDICPTSLFLISQLLQKLGPDAARINALFITVDPARDTPEQMKAYLAAYDPHLRGLTGDPAQLALARDIYGVDARILPGASKNYNMDHTSTVFLLDANARLRAEFDLRTTPDEALALLRAAMAGA